MCDVWCVYVHVHTVVCGLLQLDAAGVSVLAGQIELRRSEQTIRRAQQRVEEWTPGAAIVSGCFWLFTCVASHQASHFPYFTAVCDFPTPWQLIF